MSLKEDALAGILFFVSGLLGIVIGWGYDTGTLANAGPGLAPKALSVGLMVLGSVIALRAARTSERVKPLQLRPIVIVLGGLLIFAGLIERVGLAATVTAMIVFMYIAAGERRWAEAVIVGGVFGLVCTALFVFGLKLSFKPGWW